MKEIGNNKHVLNLSLASNEYYKDSSGERQSRATWHRVTAWDNAAKILAGKCETGSRLLVEGRLEKSSGKKTEKSGIPLKSGRVNLCCWITKSKPQPKYQ